MRSAFISYGNVKVTIYNDFVASCFTRTEIPFRSRKNKLVVTKMNVFMRR